MIGYQLSGSHVWSKYIELLKRNEFSNIPVVVGGIIPPVDEKLISIGVKAVLPQRF